MKQSEKLIQKLKKKKKQEYFVFHPVKHFLTHSVKIQRWCKFIFVFFQLDTDYSEDEENTLQAKVDYRERVLRQAAALVAEQEDDEDEEEEEEEEEDEDDEDLALLNDGQDLLTKKQRAAEWKALAAGKAEQTLETKPGRDIDLSSQTSRKGMLEPVTVVIGGGYSVLRSIIQIPPTKGAEGGSYEGITVRRSYTPKQADKSGERNTKELNLNFPIRLLTTIMQALLHIHRDAAHKEIPPLDAMLKEGKTYIDLGIYGHTSLPKHNIKLDDMHALRCEEVNWGKGSYDVVTFSKSGKDTTKKPFSISVPEKYFENLFFGFKYLASL